MPNMWKTKMVEQGYNYSDGPIHYAAEFFETRIENLEKSIPQVLPQAIRKQRKKCKKKKAVTLNY